MYITKEGISVLSGEDIKNIKVERCIANGEDDFDVEEVE